MRITAVHCCLVLACTVVIRPAEAGPIASRVALQALLGGTSTVEDFESYVPLAGLSDVLDCAALDSSATCNGQGPGLVGVDVAFTIGSDGQWNDAGYLGAPSREILAGIQPLVIDFLGLVDAFGLDLRAFEGYSATATMSMYGTDDVTLLGTMTGLLLPDTGLPVFAGFADASGIGRVELTQVEWPWSPMIDNLEFGARAVPEPGTILLLTAGIAATAWRIGIIGARLRARRQRAP